MVYMKAKLVTDRQTGVRTVVIGTTRGETLDEARARLLSAGRQYMLPFTFERSVQETTYRYDVTSYSTLHDLLRSPIPAGVYAGLLLGVLGVIEGCAAHGVPESCVAWDPKFVFMSPQGFPLFAVAPVLRPANVRQNATTLLETLRDKARCTSPEEQEYRQRLREFLAANPVVTPPAFHDFMAWLLPGYVRSSAAGPADGTVPVRGGSFPVRDQQDDQFVGETIAGTGLQGGETRLSVRADATVVSASKGRHAAATDQPEADGTRLATKPHPLVSGTDVRTGVPVNAVPASAPSGDTVPRKPAIRSDAPHTTASHATTPREPKPAAASPAVVSAASPETASQRTVPSSAARSDAGRPGAAPTNAGVGNAPTPDAPLQGTQARGTAIPGAFTGVTPGVAAPGPAPAMTQPTAAVSERSDDVGYDEGETMLRSTPRTTTGFTVRRLRDGRVLSTARRRATIGRSKTADLHMGGNTNVSRIHAIIEMLPDGRFSITDNKSANGTSVSGRPLAPGGTEYVASGGDFELADDTFVITRM